MNDIIDELRQQKNEECKTCSCQRYDFCLGYEKALDHLKEKVNNLDIPVFSVPKGTYCECTDEPMRLAMSLTKCASCQKIVED
ncbi:hypothetical protein PANI_CDS0080 [Maribacter phage Panino]